MSIVPFLVVTPALFVLVFPAVIVLGYLFYAVPFLFVVDDAGFLEAFRRSYEFTLEGGSYFQFALWYVVVAASTSFVLSIALNMDGVGFVMALVGTTPIALVLTAATVSLVQELVGNRGSKMTAGDHRPGTTADGTSEFPP